MKMNVILAATALSAIATTAVSGDYQVTRTLQLSAPSFEVWRVIGDFCDIDDWHPGVTDCELKVIDGRLNRVLTTGDGGRFQEQRIATEAGLSYTYRIVDSPLQVARYAATLSVEPGEGARVTWSASFSSDDPAMEGVVTGLIEAGLEGIESALQ